MYQAHFVRAFKENKSGMKVFFHDFLKSKKCEEASDYFRLELYTIIFKERRKVKILRISKCNLNYKRTDTLSYQN